MKSKKGNLSLQAVVLMPLYIVIFTLLLNSILSFTTRSTLESYGGTYLRRASTCDTFDGDNGAFSVLKLLQNDDNNKIKICNNMSVNEDGFTYDKLLGEAYVYIYPAGTNSTNTSVSALASCIIPQTGQSDASIEFGKKQMNNNWKIGNVLIINFVNMEFVNNFGIEAVRNVFSIQYFDKKIVLFDPVPRIQLRITIENQR